MNAFYLILERAYFFIMNNLLIISFQGKIKGRMKMKMKMKMRMKMKMKMKMNKWKIGLDFVQIRKLFYTQQWFFEKFIYVANFMFINYIVNDIHACQQNIF
jgi:hypothetical protein